MNIKEKLLRSFGETTQNLLQADFRGYTNTKSYTKGYILKFDHIPMGFTPSPMEYSSGSISGYWIELPSNNIEDFNSCRGIGFKYPYQRGVV